MELTTSGFKFLLVLILSLAQNGQNEEIHRERRQISPKTLRIVSTINEPFLMERATLAGSPNSPPLTGNDRYVGYVKDLIEILANKMGVRYEISLPRDGRYGQKIGSRWNGMVGELIAREKDIAITDLTVTAARLEVVDFTQPFMTMGISLMMSKHQRTDSSGLGQWALLEVFSLQMWIAIILSYLVTTGLVLILTKTIHNPAASGTGCGTGGRSGPTGPQGPTSESPSTEENGGTINNNRDRSLKRLLAQSSWAVLTLDIHTHKHSQSSNRSAGDRPLAVRILIGAWWLFCLLVCAAYISNLTSNLTANRQGTVRVAQIGSIDDLGRQITAPGGGSEVNVEFGMMRGGSTETFFRESTVPIYRRMWEYLEMNPDLYVESLDEGVARVRGKWTKLYNRTRISVGGRSASSVETIEETREVLQPAAKPYAFILESPKNDYTAGRFPCDTVRVGVNLDEKGFGLAVAKGSDLLATLNPLILELHENGQLGVLKRKWFHPDDCAALGLGQLGAQPLTVANMTASFALLAVGMVVAFLSGTAISIVKRSTTNTGK